MFAAKIVLGLALVQFALAQNTYQFGPQPNTDGLGIPVVSGRGPVFNAAGSSNQDGSAGSSGQFGVRFIPGGFNDRTNSFHSLPAGVPSGVAQGGAGQNTFPTFGGVSGQSGLGVFSVPSQQGPAFLGGQGGSFAPGFGVQQVGVPVFGVQQVGVPDFGVQQVGVPGFGVQQGVQVGGVQGVGFGFPSSIIQEEVTPTVTQTVTVDTFQTLTDLVLHSVAVTLTQFSLVTTTRVTQVVVPTPVNDALAVPTSVVVQPAYVTVTETKSDFRVVVKTSVSYATLTHTSYAITHVPFTLSTTETVTVTSPVVRTVISTHVEGVTNYRTITNTAYVHGGYH